MPASSATARHNLDSRLQRLRPLLDQPRPHRGWVRAIRDALGMSGSELADRMSVTQSTVVDIENSELHGGIKLNTLRRAADALECELVYLLVPRTSLEETVHDQARRKAARHLGRVAHHSRLEDQELSPSASTDQLDQFVQRFVDRRGLWSDREA